MTRRQKGFTLLEAVVALALFGMFLYIDALLTAQMRGYEKRLPIDFLAHPQTGAVVARIRKDVMDAVGPAYYLDKVGKYQNGPHCLIVESLDESGGVRRIVWDFTIPGEAHRHIFNVGIEGPEWTARGVPQFEIDDYSISDIVGSSETPPTAADAVRLSAKDSHGKLSIDAILQPRSHR